MAKEGLIKQLLEAGVHFGHQTRKWNPKMKPYIFGSRSGIYIIDLEKTAELITKAVDFLKVKISKGGEIIFVGTKKQAQAIIKEEAVRCGMFYVNTRWLGGTLTNFATIQKSITRLKDYKRMNDEGLFDSYTKKEQMRMKKEADKLMKNLEGILNMGRLPAAMFVVDPKKDEIAVREARKLSIPVVALVDTNGNPDMVNYIIPGNDDAIKSIKFVTSFVAESIMEANKAFAENRNRQEEEARAAEHDKTSAIKEEVLEQVEDVVEKKIKRPDDFEAKMKKKIPKAGEIKKVGKKI